MSPGYELADLIKSRIQRDVLFAGFDFDGTLQLDIEGTLRTLPIQQDALNKISLRALSYDISTALFPSKMLEQAILLPIYEKAEWDTPGDLSSLIAKSIVQNPDVDTSALDIARKAAHQLREKLSNGMSSSSLPGALYQFPPEKETLQERALSELLNLSYQHSWQKTSDPSLPSGYHEEGIVGYYPRATRWSSDIHRAGWTLISDFSTLLLTDEQKDPILKALRELNVAREAAGLPSLSVATIKLCTSHQLDYAVFRSLEPSLNALKYDGLIECAKALHALNNESVRTLNAEQLSQAISSSLPRLDKQTQRASVSACQSVLTALREEPELPRSWSELSLQQETLLLHLAERIATPTVIQSLENSIASNFSPPADELPLLSLEQAEILYSNAKQKP